MLVVELDGDLVVTWGEKTSQLKLQDRGQQRGDNPTLISVPDKLLGRAQLWRHMFPGV